MKQLYTLLLVSLSCTILQAQVIDTTSTSQDSLNTDTSGFIVTDNVEVIKAFEAKLADAERVNLTPDLPEIIPIDRRYEYEVTIIPYAIKYADPVIKPVAIRKDDPEPYLNWYLKGGYGNLKNGYAHLAGHHKLGDRIDWKLDIEFANQDNSDDLALQKDMHFLLNSHQDFNVMETSKLTTEFYVGRDTRNFFYNGPDLVTFPFENEARRNRDIFGLDFSFFNTSYTETNVDYNIHFSPKVTRLSDLSSTELNLILEASATKKNFGQLALTFHAGIDNNSIQSNNDLIGFAFPALTYSGNDFYFDLGLSYIYADAASHVFPQAELGYAIDHKILQAFIGIEQNYQRNNYRNISSYNPFAVGMDSLRSNINIDYYGGVKGDILGLVYQAKAGYKDISSLAIFNVDFTDPIRRLHTTVTDLKSVYISGSIEFPLTNLITIGGSTTQNFFTDIMGDNLWGIPSLEFNAYGNISLLDDKISILPNIFIRDRVDALNENGETVELDDLLDLNLELNFQPAHNFGIWISGINLLDRNYRRWYGYPNYGIHFQGGLEVKF